ncbi:MAG: dipeptide epimerase, partial [Elusimicrobiota bacterium]
MNAPLREPFAIAGGTQAAVRNVLVEVRLSDGTIGFGECAPLPAFNGETQAAAAAAGHALAPTVGG